MSIAATTIPATTAEPPSTPQREEEMAAKVTEVLTQRGKTIASLQHKQRESQNVITEQARMIEALQQELRSAQDSMARQQASVIGDAEARIRFLTQDLAEARTSVKQRMDSDIESHRRNMRDIASQVSALESLAVTVKEEGDELGANIPVDLTDMISWFREIYAIALQLGGQEGWHEDDETGKDGDGGSMSFDEDLD